MSEKTYSSDNVKGIVGTVIALIVCAILILVFTFTMGKMIGKDEIREEAIKKGYAEYYLNKDSNRKWRWKNENETKN